MDTPSFLHYLPIASTLISAAFVVALLTRASKRNWPAHLNWWAIGVFFYGVGTAFESTITLAGNTEMLNRFWYWSGAILGGYPLATGSLYLLMQTKRKRRVAHVLTGLSLLFVIVASVLVFIGPMKLDMLQEHRPTGRGIWEWKWLPWLTPFINVYALIFLVGGAAWSSVNFVMAHNQGRRAIGTALIAFGALLPGIGGALTKTNDLPEALYVGELWGIILIWIGYEFCTRSPKPSFANGAAGETQPGEAQPGEPDPPTTAPTS